MAGLHNLVLLSSVGVGPESLALSDGKSTSWIQVVKPIKGAKKGARTFDITDEHIDQMLSNVQKSSNQVPIDYNHLSLEATLPDQTIAAGWFTGFKKDSGNLFGNAEWTDAAAERIRKKELRYISPVINFAAKDEHGEEIGARLISAALTIYPFLQGMEPVALSQLFQEGVVLADLSIDERRSRLSEAIRSKYPLDYAWLVDVFDDYLVFDRGGKKYKLNYKIDDNFSVSFPGEPQEVVSQWETVAATSLGAPHMSAANNEPNADLVALRAELATLTTTVTSLNAEMTAAKTQATAEKERADQLQTRLNTKEAEEAVGKLIKERKLKVADKEHWVALYLSDKTMFDKLVPTLQATSLALNQEHGTNEGDLTLEERTHGKDAIVEMNEAVTKYITDNGGKEKVRYGDAVRAVSVENPKLADRYRAAFATPELVER